jgi:hypothetical protein
VSLRLLDVWHFVLAVAVLDLRQVRHCIPGRDDINNS